MNAGIFSDASALRDTSTVSRSSTEVDEVLQQAALSGLSQDPKVLPAWMFYDEQGSLLFEQITEVPEYYLTRTERSILAAHAHLLPASLGGRVTIAELGAGTATKTGLLLTEFIRAQGSLLYQPIDISPSALQEAAASLSASIPGLQVEPRTANYVSDSYTVVRPDGDRILALYIGSSIGNFAPAEARSILRTLRGRLLPKDALLLGVDLAPGAHKTINMLLAAYDDAAGVTAAFNKNVLTRLNRELHADFDLGCFAHQARWHQSASRIEMHLQSLAEQTVHIAGTAIAFRAGETIHTENSYKFTQLSIDTMLSDSGFAAREMMQDEEQRFAVVLATAV